MTMTRVQTRIFNAALDLFADTGRSDITVAELARAAGVARGTIYNNLSTCDGLFEEIVTRLGAEMHTVLAERFEQEPDPAVRISHGVREFLRRAAEQPRWGRFFYRFAFSEEHFHRLLGGPLIEFVRAGMACGRFDCRQEQFPGVVAMIGGTVLCSMFQVVQGLQPWRVAGSDAAELVLKALGVDAETAHRIATSDLPADGL